MKRPFAWVTAIGFVLATPSTGLAQTTGSPNYFLPPAQSPQTGNALLAAQPATAASPVIDRTLLDTLPPPKSIAVSAAPPPWYETDWGVAGIGIAATGVAMAFDHGIWQWSNTKLSYHFRADVALRTANILELAPLAFAGATMFQSPVSDPILAHASSIAVTSAAEVTVVAMGLKYVIGRERPAESDGDPFVAHPFDASRSSFSLGAVFPGGASGTSSFPSGHTALAFALITPYAELYHAPILYTIPAVVGLGRIAAIDGHWASDVVGGGFIGWLTADLTRRFFPNSDYGLMIFADGQQMMVGINGRF
jgi:membrane-associated phospholipid phosphatase